MRYQNMENELLENLGRLHTKKKLAFLMRKSQEKEKTGI